MSTITRALRSRSWNVEICVESWRVAGIFQRDDLLLVRDIAYELELCLTFHKPDNDAVTAWQPALLPKDITDTTLIVLGQQDSSPFPTPTLGQVRSYNYVFHSSECANGHPHSLEDTCIRIPGVPKRRVDPRYMEIGRSSLDQRHIGFQTRTSSLKRRSASSRATSPSPSRTDITDTEIPTSIPIQEGNLAIRSFRGNAFHASDKGCVITREGSIDGIPGPGLEAAHIVPQCQWNTYPINNNKDIADPNSVDQLGLAWKGTWDAFANGIMLESTLHRCFDARVLAIHPKTHLVRIFIDYKMVMHFHGKHATVPRTIPEKVLQHHWDMCCLENTPSAGLIDTPGVLTNVPDLPNGKVMRLTQGDPYKQDPDTQASDTQASSGTRASDPRTFQPTSYQVTAVPPSPPSSEPASEERTFWPFGKENIQGPDTAQQLMRETGLLEKISNDEEYGRGRSREKRRCIATEENTEDESYMQSRDGYGAKRQRLDQ